MLDLEPNMRVARVSISKAGIRIFQFPFFVCGLVIQNLSLS